MACPEAGVFCELFRMLLPFLNRYVGFLLKAGPLTFSVMRPRFSRTKGSRVKPSGRSSYSGPILS
jgi:hypothetical protein